MYRYLVISLSVCPVSISIVSGKKIKATYWLLQILVAVKQKLREAPKIRNFE